MIGRLLRILIAIPLLTLVWGYSNSIGVTAQVTHAAGWPDLDYFRLPGVDQILADPTGDTLRREARGVIDGVLKEDKRLFDKHARAELTALGKQLAAGVQDHLPGGPTKATDYGTVEQFAAARDLLDDLDVKGKAAMTGYDRDEFGPAWSDAAGDFAWTRNGCDTRNDLLARDLDTVVEANCRVLSGVLRDDPYTGTTIHYVYGNGNLIDGEHVVALGNSWATGSFAWTEAKRAALANDPLNLIAVDAGENRSKGDGDAATWLPPNKAYRCAYVTRQVAVKARYGLWVAPAEKDAMVAVLNGCV